MLADAIRITSPYLMIGGLVGVLFGLNKCNERDIKSQGDEIGNLLTNVKIDKAIEQQKLSSVTLPNAKQIISAETTNYIFNFNPSAPEDSNGILLVFSKVSIRGNGFAKINSKGELLDGNALLGSDALKELRQYSPDILKIHRVER